VIRGILVAILSLLAPIRTATPAENEAASPIVVEIVPATLEFPLNRGTARALVIVRNKGSERLLDVRVAAWTEAGARVVVEEGTPRDVVPNGDSVWTLQFTRIRGGLLPGTVHVRIDYNQKFGTVGAAVPRVVLTSLELKPAPVETLDQIAEVQVQSSLEALTEQTPGRVYLVITNKTNLELDASVKPHMPKFLKVGYRRDRGRTGLAALFSLLFRLVRGGPADPPDDGRDAMILLKARLGPHEAGVVEVPVMAGGRVQPGKHMLVFDVDLRCSEGVETFDRHVVLNREVTVGVLGESTLLTLIGVPTLLFLPGFLIVRTYKLLWTLGFLKSKYDTGRFPLEETADQVLVQILISLLVLVVSTGFRWDYVGLYGLSDLVDLYLVSVLGLGAGLYIVGMAVRGWWVRGRFPESDEGALAVLKKLGKQGRDVLLERYDLGPEPSHQDVFLLEPPRSNRDHWWVGPPIHVEFKSPGESLAQDLKTLDDAKKQFDDAKKQFDDAKKQFDDARNQFDDARNQFDAKKKKLEQRKKLDRDINYLLESGRKMKELYKLIEKNTRKPLLFRSGQDALKVSWKRSGRVEGPTEAERSELKVRRSSAPIIDWRTPCAGDEPVTVLRKLARQGLGVALDRFDLGTEEKPDQVFLLEPWVPTRETSWVAPKLELSLSSPGAGLDEAALNEIKVEIDKRIEDGKPDLLADALEDALGKNAMNYEWKSGEAVKRAGPEELKTESLLNSAEKRVPNERWVKWKA
jgi:hypothetical protein